jgi:hypothetical protein
MYPTNGLPRPCFPLIPSRAVVDDLPSLSILTVFVHAYPVDPTIVRSRCNLSSNTFWLKAVPRWSRLDRHCYLSHRTTSASLSNLDYPRPFPCLHTTTASLRGQDLLFNRNSYTRNQDIFFPTSISGRK